MPDKKSVQTGWVIAATEGATVDGRNISKAWLEDIAELYSTDVFTALIWPEHSRSSWGRFNGKNWGTVDEVKVAKKGGKLRLFVKLTANSYLLEANKDGQQLFMSIEPEEDFQKTGKCYLLGLAVTDNPASIGTTRLKFSMGDNEVQHDYSQLEALQHSDFIFTHCETNSQDNPSENQSKEAEAKSLLTKLVNLFSINPTTQAAETPDNAEDETMKQEQFDALMAKFDGVTSQVTNLEEKFTGLETKVEKFSTPPGYNKDDNGEGGDGGEDDKKEKTVTAEQFSQLTDSISGLTEKFTGIETKFNKLNQEVDGQEPDPAGQGESVSLT